MSLFKPKEPLKYIDTRDPSVRRCFQRGFFPLGDNTYIDEYMTEVTGIDKFIIIPEIETTGVNLINDVVNNFDQYFADNGELPGSMLVNMSTWMFAWGLEMAWRWNKGNLDSVLFVQDMNTFDVPMNKFQLMPQTWYSDIINTFMDWCYSNPGYTDKYEINVYDPIRDGYLTMIRCAVTKVLPKM